MGIQSDQFQTAEGQPLAYKAFTPLQPGDPTKYDPSGQEHTYSDVPWRVRMGRMRPKEFLGETYVRGGLSRGGYIRSAMNSTLED